MLMLILYVYVCRQTCLVYLCVDVDMYVMTFILMQADMYEHVGVYIWLYACM